MFQDATTEYEPIHAPGTLEKFLPSEKHLGEVSGDLPTHAAELERVQDVSKQAPLSTLQNLDEFEQEAMKYLSEKAWIYYNSAADSLTSHVNNIRDWDRVVLRPRVLR